MDADVALVVMGSSEDWARWVEASRREADACDVVVLAQAAGEPRASFESRVEAKLERLRAEARPARVAVVLRARTRAERDAAARRLARAA